MLDLNQDFNQMI